MSLPEHPLFNSIHIYIYIYVRSYDLNNSFLPNQPHPHSKWYRNPPTKIGQVMCFFTSASGQLWILIILCHNLMWNTKYDSNLRITRTFLNLRFYNFLELRCEKGWTSLKNFSSVSQNLPNLLALFPLSSTLHVAIPHEPSKEEEWFACRLIVNLTFTPLCFTFNIALIYA